MSNQQVRAPRRSEKMSYLVAKAPNTHSTRQLRPVDGPPSSQSCVPVSVEFVDKDEDKDENVDTDQTRTERPVCGQQFTQLEEIDIDFRMPGLSHAVVKETENFRKSFTSRSTSSRLAAEKRLHPIQQQFEIDDL